MYTYLKTCSNCNDDKPSDEFYSNGWCIECNREANKEYRKTKSGMIVKLYSTQRTNSRKRGDIMPSYTKRELKDFLYSIPEFHILYDNWKRSGYKSDLKPSLDRIDDYKSYSLDNIQLMTWEENKDKGYSDRKNGINNKVSKRVKQYDKEGNFIAEYHSIMEASRKVNINNGSISLCASGKTKTGRGYVWKYS